MIFEVVNWMVISIVVDVGSEGVAKLYIFQAYFQNMNALSNPVARVGSELQGGTTSRAWVCTNYVLDIDME